MSQNSFQVASTFLSIIKTNNFGFKLSLDKFKELLEIVSGGSVDNDDCGQLFALLDADGEGTVDMQELITGFMAIAPVDQRDKATLAFRALDMNNDEALSKEELDSGIAKIFVSSLKLYETPDIETLFKKIIPSIEFAPKEMKKNAFVLCEAATESVRNFFH